MQGRIALVSTLVALPWLVSCVPLAGRAAGRATQSTVDQLAEPRTREVMAEFLSDPEVQGAARDISATIAGGIVDEVAQPERLERVGASLDDFLAVAAGSAGTRAAEAFAARSPEVTRAFLGAASTEQGRAQVSAVAGAVTQGVARSLSQEIEREIGPAMREVIRTDISKAVAEGLDDNVNEALGRTARTISREVVLGSQEALAELGSREGSVLGGVRRSAKLGIGLFKLLSLLFGVGLIVLFALYLRTLLKERRFERVSEDREAALLLLASTIKVAHGRPWGAELRELLREEMRDEPAAETIRKLLREHPELRVRMPPDGQGDAPAMGRPPHPSPA